MNLIGTFEGWVPTATDLYLRGKSLVSFSKYSNYDYPVFDSGQITINTTGYSAVQTSVNLTGYSHVNFEIYKTGTYGDAAISLGIANDVTRWAKVDLNSTLNTIQTVSITLGTLAINGTFSIEFRYWRGAVYRIWLS